MRRRFNHNQQLLKELYGRNFSLKSLLNEANLKDDLASIRRLVSAYIKFVDKNKSTIDKVMNDSSFKKILAQVEEAGHSNDEIVRFLKVFDQVRESEPDQNLNQKQRTDLTNKAIAQFGTGSKNKTQGKPETLSATKQGNKPQQKKASSGNSKVKELQELIGHNPANGIWSGTDKTWAEWVEANKSKVPVQGIDIELVKTSWKKAAAQTNGQYAGNISGMLEFAKNMKEVGDSQGEKSKDEKTTSGISREDLVKSYEPLWKIASKPGYEWNGITDKESLKRTMRSLKGDRFMFIKNVDNTSDDKDANDDAIYFTISGHKDVSNIDKATISIEKMGPHIKLLDTSFKSALEGSGVTLKQLMNADDKVIGHFPPTQPENANWTLNTKELFRIAVYGMMYKLNLNKDVIKESSYGKSRGQLYRERYFGRY